MQGGPTQDGPEQTERSTQGTWYELVTHAPRTLHGPETTVNGLCSEVHRGTTGAGEGGGGGNGAGGGEGASWGGGGDGPGGGGTL